MEAGTGMTTRLPADAGAELAHAADVNTLEQNSGRKWWLSSLARRETAFCLVRCHCGEFAASACRQRRGWVTWHRDSCGEGLSSRRMIARAGEKSAMWRASRSANRTFRWHSTTISPGR